MSKDPDFSFAAALEPDGTLLKAAGNQAAVAGLGTVHIQEAPELRSLPGNLVVIAPVISQGKIYGAIAFATSTAGVDAARDRGLNLIGALGALAALLSALIAWMMSEVLLRPVRSVLRTLEAMAAGDLSQDPETSSNDEVGAMAPALAIALEKIRGTLLATSRLATEVAAAAQDLATRSAGISESALGQAASSA